MADLDVQTAQLIIQLVQDDLYQLGNDAQNGELLSGLEFALAAQEQEFMQHWMNYGDAQFHPGARARGGGTGSAGNTGNRAATSNLGNDQGTSAAPVTRPPSPQHIRAVVVGPQVYFQSDDEDNSDSNSNTTVSFGGVRPAISNNPPISGPSASSPNSGPSNSVQITKTSRTVASVATPILVSHCVAEELSEDEDDSASSVYAPETAPSIVECYFCKEDCPIHTTIYTSCHHHLCQTCITRLIEVCIQDETTYPPKCCGNKLQINELHITDRNLHQRYELKVREYDTPAPSRVYCHRCRGFLDPNPLMLTTSYSRSSVPTSTTRYCNTCSVRTCITCKRADHSGRPCQETPEDRVFKMLTKQQGWQTCPSCTAVVERIDGCNHMTCKCTAQFCYHCATKWKQCRC